MTSIDRSMEFDAPPKGGIDVVALWSMFRSLLSGYRSRRNMIRLDGFSDSQLADIGLTRCDLPRISPGTTSGDIDGRHTRAALIRRTQLYLL